MKRILMLFLCIIISTAVGCTNNVVDSEGNPKYHASTPLEFIDLYDSLPSDSLIFHGPSGSFEKDIYIYRERTETYFSENRKIIEGIINSTHNIDFKPEFSQIEENFKDTGLLLEEVYEDIKKGKRYDENQLEDARILGRKLQRVQMLTWRATSDYEDILSEIEETTNAKYYEEENIEEDSSTIYQDIDDELLMEVSSILKNYHGYWFALDNGDSYFGYEVIEDGTTIHITDLLYYQFVYFKGEIIGANICAETDEIKLLIEYHITEKGKENLDDEEILAKAGRKKGDLLEQMGVSEHFTKEFTIGPIFKSGQYNYSNWIVGDEFYRKEYLGTSAHNAGIRFFQYGRDGI